MVWTIVAISVLSAIMIAGRAHSRRLDAEEARWGFGEERLAKGQEEPRLSKPAFGAQTSRAFKAAF